VNSLWLSIDYHVLNVRLAAYLCIRVRACVCVCVCVYVYEREWER